MLRLAVKRNRSSATRSHHRHHPGGSQSHALSDLPSYVICDSKAKGVIRHASQGFQDLFGCTADDCEGQQLSPANLLQSHELKKISLEAGLSSTEVATSIHRMTRAAEEAVQCAAGTCQVPAQVPVLLSHSSGELFVCEISWRKNVHPTLGWSYHAGLVQKISKDISVHGLLVAASQETSYAELRAEWAETAQDGFSQQLGEELHAAAEKMWKDELAKGVKPKSAVKRREEDMTSIWSRSTASTISSSKDSKEPSKHARKEGEQFGSHHFGALLGMLPPSEETVEKPLPEAEAQLPTGETFQDFASEDEFEECETMSHSSSLSVDSGPPLFDEVDDPVKHIDRQNLRQMKQAFILAALGHSDHGDMEFPVALRSAGFDASASNWPGGPAWKAKVGSNARDVFQPNVAAGPKAQMLWKTFCESFEKQQFFKTAGAGIALLGNMELVLPAGEFVFVQPFHGRLGNPIDCLVYVKHIELDDCPFILALHAYLPQDPDDHSLEEEFYKLSSQLDVVISELASEFFYYAPMRRQRTLGTRAFRARCSVQQ
eukprot:s724_g4.t1